MVTLYHQTTGSRDGLMTITSKEREAGEN